MSTVVIGEFRAVEVVDEDQDPITGRMGSAGLTTGTVDPHDG